MVQDKNLLTPNKNINEFGSNEWVVLKKISNKDENIPPEENVFAES